ncbi:Protein CL16A [Actinomortierella wolfii]|nr:Protein CL16A [Actinomortierella wolfii]
MFSLPWSKPKPERFSLENLKLLCKQLQTFPPDARKEPIITCLKELTQILIWGDQHDPLLLEYSEAIKFFNHEESMIRIAVRVITLNVYGVDDQQMQDFILDRTTTTYFSNLVWFIGNYGTTINDILLHPSEGEMSRVDYYLAEHMDCFYYINDIVELEVPKINRILISFVLNRLLRPIYIESLLPPGAHGSSNPVKSTFASPKLSPAVVLSLLLHAFHVLKYAPLVSALATTIFANHQHATAHAGSLHHPTIHSMPQKTAGLSPGSSQTSSPVSTPRMCSPLSLMGTSPGIKSHSHHHYYAKEPTLVPPSGAGAPHAPSRRSSLTDSPAANTTSSPSPTNPYKSVIFGYLSQTENDRLVLPTLLLIYLACRNTGAMADVLMGTDIYPQRLLKSRVLMGNLMSSSSLGSASGTPVSNANHSVAVPISRGHSADLLVGAHSAGANSYQNHNSLLQTMSSSFGSSTTGTLPTTNTTTEGQHSGSPQTRSGTSGTGSGGITRTKRIESPLFENSDEDEESRETEELLAGVMAYDVPLPASPNLLGDSGGSSGIADTKSSPSSRALSIRSHLSSSSLVSHLPMPQLPSPKVRQTQTFFPSSSTANAQAAVTALSTTTSVTGAPAASSSSQASITTHATMGGVGFTSDTASVHADDSTIAPSSPRLDSKESGISSILDSSAVLAATTVSTSNKMAELQDHKDTGGRRLEQVPPQLPPRHIQSEYDDDEPGTLSVSTYPLLPVVQNREELIQRLLDIVTCAGRQKQPQQCSHRFRMVTIQAATELLLEFVYVKGGLPAGNHGSQMETKRRASSSAIPTSALASSLSLSPGPAAPTPSSASNADRISNHSSNSGGNASHHSAPTRLYENMLTEEQMQQIIDAESYFRERVRRGVEFLNQHPKHDIHMSSQSPDIHPLGIKTMEVERAIQQTKLGLDKKVAGMLGDSKLLYGPPPEGDPDVDLDPDQVDDILANIDLSPPPVTTNSPIDIAASPVEDKESLGRVGRKPGRHMSLERHQNGGARPTTTRSNTNIQESSSGRRGRSVSRSRLTAFMEELGSSALSSISRKVTAAGSSSASLLSTSGSAAVTGVSGRGNSDPTPIANHCTGYGSANARLPPRTRLEKRVLRSIQWLHILVQCRQLLSHSRNVWSAPIFAGASFASMTTPANPTSSTSGGGIASSWSSSSSSSPAAGGEKAASASLVHPLQGDKNRGRLDSSKLTNASAKTSERHVDAPHGSSAPSSPPTDHPLSPTLSAVSAPVSKVKDLSSHVKNTLKDPLMAVSSECQDLKKNTQGQSEPPSLPTPANRAGKAQFIADSDDEVDEVANGNNVEEIEEEESSKEKDEIGHEQRSPSSFIGCPTHRLSLHAHGSSALLKSAAPPALASPAILLSPPMVSSSLFAANGGILGGQNGDASSEGHGCHNPRHSISDPLLLSNSVSVSAKAPIKKQRAGHGRHERSPSSSTAESSTTTTATTDTASEQQQQQGAPALTSIFDTRHPWHQKDDHVLGILGSLGFFGAAR